MYIRSQWVVVLSHVVCMRFCWTCMYFFFFSLSINPMFHSLYYVHSQPVSCFLVPCFKCVMKVHVFLFLCPLTQCSTRQIMYILSRWVVVLSHVLSMCFCWKCMHFFSFSIHHPMFRSPHTYYICIFSAGELSYPLFRVFLWNVHVLYTSFSFSIYQPNVPLYNVPLTVLCIFSACELLSCPMFWVCFYWMCMYFFSFSIHRPNIPLTVLCIFSACELLSCPMFWVCFYWKCIYFFSFSIHWPNIPLNILCTFLVGEFLSCHMFWVCVSVESACISSLSLSTNLIFHSTCYVHSQRVSCCSVPSLIDVCFCWKCMYFSSFLSIYLTCSTHRIMYILSRWVHGAVLSHVLSVFGESACISSLSPSIDLIVYSPYYVHFQPVSYAVLSHVLSMFCGKCMFLPFLYPLI